MEKTTLYLSGELQRSLLAVARREGRSQAEIVRSALAAYFSGRVPIRLRSIGAGSDDEVSGSTSEQWLRKTWENKNCGRRERPQRIAGNVFLGCAELEPSLQD